MLVAPVLRVNANGLKDFKLAASDFAMNVALVAGAHRTSPPARQ
jgi:hypothetical protein